MSLSRFAGLAAAVCLCLAAGAALGQKATIPASQPSRPNFYLGARAGFSSYTLEGKEVDLRTQRGYDQLLRAQWITAGVVARRRLVGVLAAQLEANYLREGGDFTRTAFPGRTVYTIDCLQLPLLLNLELPFERHLSLHVEGGAAFTAILQGVELDASSFAPGNSFSNPSSFFAPVYGAELAWHQERNVYFFNARYSHDLTDYYQRRYTGIDYNARSNGFTLALGVLFGR